MNQNNFVKEIIEELNEQINFFKNYKIKDLTIGTTWETRAQKISSTINKNPEVLIKFKKSNIFNSDVPAGNMNIIKKFIYNFFLYLPHLIRYHPYINMLEDGYDFLKKKNLLNLALENPITETGLPLIFKKKGLKYTFRWLRHILLLDSFNKHLQNKKDLNFIADIGTGFGTFPYIIKRNYPKKKFILIDLPEQLCAANYYLKSEFPNLRFATFKDLKNVEIIDRNFVENFDFVLVPCFFIDKLSKNVTDLITNFASFNEMPRFWFKKYMNSEIFNGAKYLFTMNRIIRPQMDQTKDLDISIMDLPLEKYEKIHFDIFELYKWRYESVKVFNIPLYGKKVWFDTHYEYIGSRKT